MPFIKSNWTCSPSLEDGGYFEFSTDHILQDLTLTRAEQTRPCFLHVSSEVECVVVSLSLIASVEILDVYALVGPLDTFDYRHVSKLQGTAIDDTSSSPRFSFTMDASLIPKEQVWQLQLKLSSSAQGIVTVCIDRLSVHVTKTGGGVLPPTSARVEKTTFDNTDQLNTSTKSVLFSSARSAFNTSTRSTTTAMDVSSNNMSRSRALANPITSPGRMLDVSSSTAVAPQQLGGSRARSSNNTRIAGGLNSKSMGDLAGSSVNKIPTMESSLRNATSKSAVDLSGSASTTSIVGQRPARGLSSSSNFDLTVRGRAAETSALATASSQGSSLMREETAAVASVLNAVCEKMVGVVSEKTKAYLAKAGKRTEKRVLDKMQKLEERIERFDNVLEHATISSREIEQALLALDRDLSSPHQLPTGPSSVTAAPAP